MASYSSSKHVIKNVCVNLSRSEFYKFAKQYKVFDEVCCLKIRIVRSDFDYVQADPKLNETLLTTTIKLVSSDFGINGTRFTKSITLMPSDFAQHSPKQVIALAPVSEQANLYDGYNFRKRKMVEREDKKANPPAKRARTEIIRMNSVTKLITAPKDMLKEGLVVIAKMRSFAAWPARIVSFRKTVVTVNFFGDETIGNVPYKDIGLFETNRQLIKGNLVKKIDGYAKAVQTMEMVLKIPNCLSILNLD